MSSKLQSLLGGKLPSLDGKISIVTGANTGIGYDVASELANQKCNVILACRDIEKGERAANEIRTSSKHEDVHFHKLDLASLKAVKTFCDEVKEKYGRINYLICNAGVWMPMEKGVKTEGEGFELHFGVNYLAHFLLTELIIECMSGSETDDARIVIVSSSLMDEGRLDMDNTDEFVYTGRQLTENVTRMQKIAPTGYCDSKLLNSLHCRLLTETKHVEGLGSKNSGESVEEEGPIPSQIATYSVCPGWCGTELGRNVETSIWKRALLAPIFFMFRRPCREGAEKVLYLILQDKSKLRSGQNYRNFVETPKAANDRIGEIVAQSGDKLWKLSKQLLTKYI